MKYIVTHTDGSSEEINANTAAEAKAAADAAAGRSGKTVQSVKEKNPQ